MNSGHTLATAAVGLALLTACSGNDASSNGAAPQRTSISSSATAAATTPLEGGWTTDLKRSAVIAYMRKAGWSRDAQRALLDPSMAGPAKTHFRIDFVGDRFRMSQVATDVQWQSGTFDLKNGGTISLDDEAPVGYLTFRYHLDGDHLTFDHPASDPPGGTEFLPGVPDWAPGAVMWASEPWHRETSQ